MSSGSSRLEIGPLVLERPLDAETKREAEITQEDTSDEKPPERVVPDAVDSGEDLCVGVGEDSRDPETAQPGREPAPALVRIDQRERRQRFAGGHRPRVARARQLYDTDREYRGHRAEECRRLYLEGEPNGECYRDENRRDGGAHGGDEADVSTAVVRRWYVLVAPPGHGSPYHRWTEVTSQYHDNRRMCCVSDRND